MGKQKIERLLAQLKENQQQDIQSSAAIFTVAQSAVNELASVQADDAQIDVAALPDIRPSQLTRADLIAQYGNYNACRKAAKNAGISFSRSPRWPQLIAAFNYIEACQACVTDYITRHPNPSLKGVKLTLTL